LTQSREEHEPLRTLAPSLRLLDATWRDLVSLVASLVARRANRCAIWRTAQSGMAHAATEAHLSKGASATKQPARNYERLPARVFHPSASALQVLALQNLALDARAALRHSIGTPIPICHITRSLIRKHRLYAQRKKDDRLRRSRNTSLLLRNNRIQSGSILNQSCV
jgi:hypothetical protein